MQAKTIINKFNLEISKLFSVYRFCLERFVMGMVMLWRHEPGTSFLLWAENLSFLTKWLEFKETISEKPIRSLN